LRGFPDRIRGENGGGAGDDHFDFHLRQEIDDIFCPAIEFGVALLPAEAFHFRDGDPGNARFPQRLFHFIELERFDVLPRIFFIGMFFLDFLRCPDKPEKKVQAAL
jgi:hypothetical protein